MKNKFPAGGLQLWTGHPERRRNPTSDHELPLPENSCPAPNAHINCHFTTVTVYERNFVVHKCVRAVFLRWPSATYHRLCCDVPFFFFLWTLRDARVVLFRGCTSCIENRGELLTRCMASF
ncbi:unnamed protein product [Ixodes persulcatus]